MKVRRAIGARDKFPIPFLELYIYGLYKPCTCMDCASHSNLTASVRMHTRIINPRRACARVTVLVLSVCLCVCVSVCLCVCFPYSGTSRIQAYKQQYQRLQRDTGMKYKKGFFFKTLRSEVMASFTHLE